MRRSFLRVAFKLHKLKVLVRRMWKESGEVGRGLLGMRKSSSDRKSKGGRERRGMMKDVVCA